MRDFFTDLRERRLLPIIALLVVCLIAIPFLMGGGGEEAVPPPPPSAATDEPLPGIETRPVVVATPTELRNFKQRLAAFNSRNPFRQNLPEPADESGGDGTGTGTDAGLTGTSTDPGVTPVPTDPGVPPVVVPPTGEDEESGDKIISVRIDVEVGRTGNLKTREGVKSLDFLPDPQHPVVQYISGEFNLSRAAFVVSSGIEATSGDGKCAPSPDNCQFLLMRPGDEQEFIYRAEDYTLRLLDIKRHIRDADSEDLQEGRTSEDNPRGSVRNSYDVVEGG